MTSDDFRRLALAYPETTESSHMDHPDFRVCGKIFATLDSPEAGWAMVRLTPEQQGEVVDGEMCIPAKGAWGVRGATHVLLKKMKKEAARRLIAMAWRNTAPRTVVMGFDRKGSG